MKAEVCSKCGGKLAAVFEDDKVLVLNCRACGADTVRDAHDEELVHAADD